MRPTGPLLLITVLQGWAGGMILGLAVASAVFSRLGAVPSLLEPVILGIALVGGVSSFFHMHRIQAARYVLRRLKTSWLSREALTTGFFIGGLVILGFGIEQWHWRGMVLAVTSGVVAALGLVAMFVTAMLYATIPAMRSWHSPVTVVSMMGMGISGGWVFMGALATVAGDAPLGFWFAAVGLGLVIAMVVVKGLQVHFFRVMRQQITAGTGTGLHLGPYRLQDTGTTRAPYRTQTQIWPELSAAQRRLGYGLTFVLLAVVPLLTLVGTLADPKAPWLIEVAAVSLVFAAFAERWMFFADATHSSRVWFSDQERPRSKVATRRFSPAFVERFRKLNWDHGHH